MRKPKFKTAEEWLEWHQLHHPKITIGVEQLFTYVKPLFGQEVRRDQICSDLGWRADKFHYRSSFLREWMLYNGWIWDYAIPGRSKTTYMLSDGSSTEQARLAMSALLKRNKVVTSAGSKVGSQAKVVARAAGASRLERAIARNLVKQAEYSESNTELLTELVARLPSLELRLPADLLTKKGLLQLDEIQTVKGRSRMTRGELMAHLNGNQVRV